MNSKKRKFENEINALKNEDVKLKVKVFLFLDRIGNEQ